MSHHETTPRTTAGAEVHQDGTHFRVWAPRAGRVRLILESSGQTRDIHLEREAEGYYFAAVSDVGHGQRYWYELDGRRFPDPASRWQPEGVFGPSEVVDPSRFAWTDSGWRGIALDQQVLYEMHVGTFTQEGSWRAAMEVWISLLERTNRWEGAAMQWMAIGEPGRAMDALEHCIKSRTTYLCFTAQNPYFRPLHNDARFKAILRALKLARVDVPA